MKKNVLKYKGDVTTRIYIPDRENENICHNGAAYVLGLNIVDSELC